MLSIIGGTYFEDCVDPAVSRLFGSGLRAAIALSNIGQQVHLSSCVGKSDRASVEKLCNSYGIATQYVETQTTVTFHFDHPLSGSEPNPEISETSKIILPKIDTSNALYYGLLEGHVAVKADYLVYDPQNGQRLVETGSQANHLAIILNRKEAVWLSGLSDDTPLAKIGKTLMESEGAEVIIIKNGSKGARGFTVQRRLKFLYTMYRVYGR